MGAETALGVILLVGASLLVRSLIRLGTVDPGVDPEGVLTTQVELTSARFPEREELVLGLNRILEGIEAIPGVQAVGAVSIVPFSQGASDTYVYAQGRPPERPMDPANTAQIRPVTEGYFAAMGIELLRGRVFGPEDQDPEGHSTIIDATLADRLWPDEDPVGKELVLALDSMTARVVGVVEGVRRFGLGTPPSPTFYLPFGQEPYRSMDLVVKARDPGAVAGPLRAAVWEVDPDQPLSRLTALNDLIVATTASNRFQTVLLGLFAGMALLLASVGLYGVLAFFVGERRQEIGLRMALGAEPASTVGLVLRRGGLLVSVGTVLGLAGSLALTRLLTGLLYGVEPLDPVSFTVAPILLISVGLLASYLPARRASRIDPAVALRSE